MIKELVGIGFIALFVKVLWSCNKARKSKHKKLKKAKVRVDYYRGLI